MQCPSSPLPRPQRKIHDCGPWSRAVTIHIHTSPLDMDKKANEQQSQFQTGMGQFDNELSKYPYLVNFEKQTNVPKVYVIGGVGALYFLLIFFNLGGQLLVNLAGFSIPAYYSLQDTPSPPLISAHTLHPKRGFAPPPPKTPVHADSLTYRLVSQALFTTQKADDTQWLTYWVCFSFLSVLEAGFEPTYWVPFYYLFKFAFILWLALPQFSGAQILFRNALYPLFARYFQAPNRAANIRAKADAAEKPHVT
ncbi:protein yop1 [Drechslerella dactyloides]|uniref:Protein YOP1 n=1 Tax=Drechslerella dactyloides TaxID=74499 RepID=A0AAD6NMI6_DREDA|nr:protein yop1 [Drechslerella dactyloides]